MSQEATLNVLRIDSSARQDGSVTRQLGNDLVAGFRTNYRRVSVVHRDLAKTPPGLIDSNWLAANLADPEERNSAQRAILAPSDELVAELTAADAVVLGVPIYNFGVPAALKAWIDQIARARVTFRYTADGPEGLLKNKCAYVLLASGGVGAGSETDFASGYLRHLLSFLGIGEIQIIAADRGMLRDDALDGARKRIRGLLPARAA